MKKQLFLFISLFFLSVTIFAQKLSWNPTEKINGNVYQYFIGSAGGNYYMLMSNQPLRNETKKNRFFTNEIGFTISNNDITLVKYDQEFKILSQVEIKFGKKSKTFIAGMASDKGIVLFYNGKEKTNPVYADKFTLDGVYSETKTIIEKGDGFDVSVSPDGRKSCLYGNGELDILGDDLTESAKKDLPAKTGTTTTAHITNNGEVYGLCDNFKEGKMMPFYYSSNGTMLGGTMTLKGEGKANNILINNYVYLNKDKIYVITVAGKSYQKMEKSIIRGYTPVYIGFSGTSYEVHAFSCANMQEVASGTNNFSKDLVAKCYEKPDMKNLVGIDGMEIQNTFVNDAGELFIVAQTSLEKNLETTTERAGSRSTSSSEYSYINGSITVFKTDAKMNTIGEKVIERTLEMRSYFIYETSLASLWSNGKLWLMFNNQAKSNPGFIQCSLNPDLSIADNTAIPVFKDAKLQMCPSSFYDIGNQKYLMFGVFQKNVGSATFTF